MKKIDVHLHPHGEKDPLMDEYVELMHKGEVVAGLVHGSRSDRKSRNEEIVRVCEKHRGKLFGSVCVDFLDKVEDVIGEIKHYASAGFKSIKLFPNFGYHPSDPKYDKIWETVEELGLMCLSHCGWLGSYKGPKNVDQLTARPFCFERAARNHQGINFIMAHFGGGAYYLETCVLTLRLPNFFADTCPGWGRWVFDNRMPGLTSLDFSHIMYGTDCIGTGYETDEHYWTRVHKSMGRSDEDIERYFYKNAAKLLGIEE